MEQQLRDVCTRLEARLALNPFSVLNEAEFQAVLHIELLQAFPQNIPMALAPGVVDRRPGLPLLGRRVYREAKIRPGQAGQEPDLIVLKNSPQVIVAKENGAPSRFACPYEAIIETKMDASPSQVLAGHRGRAVSPRLIEADLAKWRVPEEAAATFSIVYTSYPEWYAAWPHIISVRRPIAETKHRLPSQATVDAACEALGEAVKEVHANFQAHPFSFLREKDFETELFRKMRGRIAVAPDELHPVRCQWWSENAMVLGRRRRHDLVVLGSEAREIALEVELKTSHSDRHNWYRTPALTGEFSAMQMLRDSGSLHRAVFLMFRFGPERWQSDAEALCARFPAVEFDCRCSETAV